nr:MULTISPECIES: GPR1/FUN34/YaaH family transporter [unclassified Rhodococcus (in: high G+C Gram-positive bacteria)]
MGLGFTNTGIVDAASASVPIVMSATSIGLLIATIWAASLRQNINATLYAVFFGFYGSYAALSLGLTHNWFGITADQVQATTALWTGSWLLTIGMLTVLVVRLPWSFPFLLAIVDVALVLLLIGTLATSTLATQVGGWVVFLFVAVAMYLYVAAMWEETGGSPLPMGRPLVS